MPGAKNGSKTHHCPKKSQGNCRPIKNTNYCKAHQQICPDHPDAICLIGEKCNQCKAGKRSLVATMWSPQMPLIEIADSFCGVADDAAAREAAAARNKG